MIPPVFCAPAGAVVFIQIFEVVSAAARVMLRVVPIIADSVTVTHGASVSREMVRFCVGDSFPAVSTTQTDWVPVKLSTKVRV